MYEWAYRTGSEGAYSSEIGVGVWQGGTIGRKTSERLASKVFCTIVSSTAQRSGTTERERGQVTREL